VPDSPDHVDPLELTATARDHDAVTRAGSVLLDDGTALSYDSSAFDAGGLRLLRSGQRVRLRLDVPLPQGHITAITLATFDLR
jgi:2-phospho-L-lactate guanylyltransferase